WHVTAGLIAFAAVALLLAGTVIVGMRVSWVPLRDTATGIGLGEVASPWYPLSIDGLDGVALIAAICLYGRDGYRAAIGTVIGLTVLSTMLNVAHGLDAAGVTAESAWTTWSHVILAAAAPNACIALGAHLVAVMFHQRLRVLIETWLDQRATREPRAPKVERPRPSRPRKAPPAVATPRPSVAPRAEDATSEPETRPASAKPTPKRDLVTAKQAAGLTGVHRATIDTWVREGRLPIATKHEMGWRLYDADVVRTLARTGSN
ncbi:MerR family transcriptional regulator, partial [Embleya sp. NPDC001921]